MRSTYGLVSLLSSGVPDLRLNRPTIAQRHILGRELDTNRRRRILRQRVVHVLCDEACLPGFRGSNQYYLIKMAFTHINFYLNFLIII